MQNKIFFVVNFMFLQKNSEFSAVFSVFYGQRSVTAAWATRSPWSIPAIFCSRKPGPTLVLGKNMVGIFPLCLSHSKDRLQDDKIAILSRLSFQDV